MNRVEIVALLTELGRRLALRSISGEMYVVGGAAIALAFDERRSTRDIDAVFEPKAIIYEVAGEMAAESDLSSGWLNDAAKGFIGDQNPEATSVFESTGLRVSTASPRILLAMKVLAHRVGEDEDDVMLLARHLKLTTAEGVLGVAAAVYGDRLDAAERFFVEELFA
jgi:hypothetical protein